MSRMQRNLETGRLTSDSEGTFSSLQVGLQAMCPRWLGMRLSAGVHRSRHYLRAHYNEWLGFDGYRHTHDQDGRTGYGWSLGLEAPPIVGDLIRLEAGFSDTSGAIHVTGAPCPPAMRSPATHQESFPLWVDPAWGGGVPSA